MKSNRDIKRAYFKMLDRLNDEGLERVFEQIENYTSCDRYLKDEYKTNAEKAQVINFISSRG